MKRGALFTLLTLFVLLTLGERAREVAGVTVKMVKRGGRWVRQVYVDLRTYWYGKRPHRPQERFLFGGILRAGKRLWSKFRALLGGRGLGKTYALVRKALLLAQLNQGKPGAPIFGAILGRTLKEVEDKILPILMQECAALERDTGVRWVPEYDAQRRILWFPGRRAAAYILSYEDQSSLELIRGYTLGWAVVDEIEVAPVPIERILAVVNFAVRHPDARHKCFAWASSPKGLKGMAKLHYDAFKRMDPDYYLVHGTIYDNPHLSPEDVATIKRTIPSRRLWMQEGLALCVMPRNTVFPEYDEKIHLQKHAWVRSDKTWISIDWGLAKGYMCAFKVNARGEWFLVKERKVTDTTRKRFRAEVERFVDECRVLDGGAWPYGMSCDRAVRSERTWLERKYGKVVGRREGGQWRSHVMWLSPNAEMRVEWGCAIVSSLLEPEDGAPKLLISDALTPSTEFATMGIRGAFQRYAYETGRDRQTGEELVFDTPSKKNAADDPIDAVRYAIVATRFMPELHGGKPLPFVAGDEDKAPAPARGAPSPSLRYEDLDGYAWAA